MSVWPITFPTESAAAAHWMAIRDAAAERHRETGAPFAECWTAVARELEQAQGVSLWPR